MSETRKDFWVDVALDYDKDQAWILRKSPDCCEVDLVDGSEASDSGIDISWIKDAVPGLYRLTLRPWSDQTYDGEYDTGLDVIKAKCLILFPE